MTFDTPSLLATTNPLVISALKEVTTTLAMVCELANGLAVRVAYLENRVARLEREMTLAQGCILELADNTLQEGTDEQ